MATSECSLASVCLYCTKLIRMSKIKKYKPTHALTDLQSGFNHIKLR